jgi:hypothetical protein
VLHYGFHAKVGQALRHTNKQTTEKYLQVMDQGMREMMASLEENEAEILKFTHSTCSHNQ